MKKIDIKDLITEEFEHKVQNSFAYATGYGIVFVDPDGNHIGEGSNFTNFCRCINSTQKGRDACARSNKEGFDVALKTHKPCTYICHAGLINIVIPFHYNNCYIGALTAGQVMCNDNQKFLICKENLLSEWMKDETLKKYYAEIEVYDSDKIEAMTASLADIQDYIFSTHLKHDMELELEEKERKLLLYEKKHIELEHQLKVTQLEMLQKKIIPHFMFNVMNSISRLIAMNENEKAQSMLNAFAKMMRYKASNAKLLVGMEEELEYIKNYLLIQNIRFGDRISYNIICDDSLRHFNIPFFSLQPFVENSIEHGLLNKPAGGFVEICCKNERERVVITITDNGTGINPQDLAFIKNNILTNAIRTPEKHVGMFNCYKRYKVVFGDRVNIYIESIQNEKTVVTIIIEK